MHHSEAGPLFYVLNQHQLEGRPRDTGMPFLTILLHYCTNNENTTFYADSQSLSNPKDTFPPEVQEYDRQIGD